MIDKDGYRKLTASGVVQSSGKPIALSGISIESKASGEGIVTLYDGTGTTGTKIRAVTGLVDDWYNEDYAKGRVFPSGLYVDMDTNTTSVVVWYQAVS